MRYTHVSTVLQIPHTATGDAHTRGGTSPSLPEREQGPRRPHSPPPTELKTATLTPAVQRYHPLGAEISPLMLHTQAAGAG